MSITNGDNVAVVGGKPRMIGLACAKQALYWVYRCYVLHSNNIVCLFDLILYVPVFLPFFLYTARPSFEYYRQVYFVHSGLQDESLQVIVGFFNLHRG